MKNKTIIWVVVAVVVVLGLFWALMGRSGGGAGGAAQSGSAAPTSMAALLAAGTSQKCTFSNSDAQGGAQSNGTVYTASGHMRGDFSVVTANGTMMSHMITDGTTSWVWTDASAQVPAQGMKMSFSDVSGAQGQTGASTHPQSVDPNKSMNYNCSGWSADQSEFTVPTNITFSDMSDMMKNLPTGAGAAAGASAGAGAAAGANAGGGSAMCQQCNQISDPTQKAQCLTVLGCK